MKFNYGVTALLALLSSCAVKAGFPDTELKNRELAGGNNGNGNGNGGNNDNDEEEVVIMVQFADAKGRDKAKGMTKNGKFDAEVGSLSTASFKGNRGQMKQLLNDPDIKYVEESQTLYALPNMMRGSLPTDDGHRELSEDSPYGIGKVQADQLAQGNTSIKICVVDTGYNIGHTDLPDTSNNPGFSIDGSNYESNTGEPWNTDGHGHGSHCAGTIGAVGNNGKGVTSINPDPSKFSFYIGKGLSNSGSGSSMTVKRAVEACVANGAKIVSMSLGGGGYSGSDAEMYKNYYDVDNVLFVGAAGNDGNSAYGYPASYQHVMSVAASDSNDNKASFSQFNDQVEIAAPGVGVQSTITGDNYAAWSGTSMACPHVAGVAALVWSHFPACKNWQIRNALLVTAKQVSGMYEDTCNDRYGHGIVQAKAAYDFLTEEGCDTEETPPQVIGGCDQTGDSAPTPTPPPPSQSLPNPFSWVLEIVTDNWGYETSMTLDYDFGRIATFGYGYFDSFEIYPFAQNYPPQYCYTITISDSYGDGIYYGSYKLTVNGIVLNTYNGGEFFSSRTMTFGDGCSGGSTTNSVQSNNVEIRDAPKNGNGKGGNKNGLKTQSNNFIDVPLPIEHPEDVEDEN